MKIIGMFTVNDSILVPSYNLEGDTVFGESVSHLRH